jgi:hypothetical protein
VTPKQGETEKKKAEALTAFKAALKAVELSKLSVAELAKKLVELVVDAHSADADDVKGALREALKEYKEWAALKDELGKLSTDKDATNMVVEVVEELIKSSSGGTIKTVADFDAALTAAESKGASQLVQDLNAAFTNTDAAVVSEALKKSKIEASLTACLNAIAAKGGGQWPYSAREGSCNR